MKNTLKFYHVRRESKKIGKAGHCGVMTVATQVKGENVDLGFAFCSPNDNFEKALGRKIATGQLLKKPVTTQFTGNSANDIVFMWNQPIMHELYRWKNGKQIPYVPQIWRHSKMANIEQTGLTVLNKV
jgi:hypothetical protein